MQSVKQVAAFWRVHSLGERGAKSRNQRGALFGCMFVSGDADESRSSHRADLDFLSGETHAGERGVDGGSTRMRGTELGIKGIKTKMYSRSPRCKKGKLF